jgi:hypothetical protein
MILIPILIVFVVVLVLINEYSIWSLSNAHCFSETFCQYLWRNFKQLLKIGNE